MKIYSLDGAQTVTDPGDPDNGVKPITYDAADDGSFELPDELAARLHSQHIAGAPAWETENERSERLIAEDLERKRDPQFALAELQRISDGVENGRQLTAAELREAEDMRLQIEAERQEADRLRSEQLIAEAEEREAREADERARVEQDEQERADREKAEQEKLAAEERELQAKRDADEAEQQRLADEKAALDAANSAEPVTLCDHVEGNLVCDLPAGHEPGDHHLIDPTVPQTADDEPPALTPGDRVLQPGSDTIEGELLSIDGDRARVKWDGGEEGEGPLADLRRVEPTVEPAPEQAKPAAKPKPGSKPASK